MRFLLSVLIWVSVGVGAISAVPAYFTPTDLDPELYRSETEAKAGPEGYLFIIDPAGPLVPREGEAEFMYPIGTELTPRVLAEMSAEQPNGEPLVDRVHVPEFSWDRWTHRWWFIGAIVLLTTCGLGQRLLARGEKVVKKGAADPRDSVAAAVREVEAILSELPGARTELDRLHMIVERVGELQASHMANFADAREILVSRHGLGRFAEIMDAFAGAERKVNRAWSAAADSVLGESVENLESSIPLLRETQNRMG